MVVQTIQKFTDEADKNVKVNISIRDGSDYVSVWGFSYDRYPVLLKLPFDKHDEKKDLALNRLIEVGRELTSMGYTVCADFDNSSNPEYYKFESLEELETFVIDWDNPARKVLEENRYASHFVYDPSVVSHYISPLMDEIILGKRPQDDNEILDVIIQAPEKEVGVPQLHLIQPEEFLGIPPEIDAATQEKLK